MKAAIVHDYLIQMGGAERVVAAMHKLFPQAPVFTSVFRKNKLSDDFSGMDIRTSFLQNWPLMDQEFRLYFLLYPLAFYLMDLSGYDLVISSSSAYAKGIKKRKGQLHICYCHTPMRFAWRFDDYIRMQGLGNLSAAVLSPFMSLLRMWDRWSSDNVDHFIANSAFIAARIKSIYNRDSVIIHPPVETSDFDPAGADGDYFLIVSRLLSYKRIDIAVNAFCRLQYPLKIVGEGPARRALEKISGPNIEFLGRLPDDQVKRLFSGCRALIFPGEEDFGITPIEAAASGRPTIAYRGGGALETVIDGETGVMFNTQESSALAEAVIRFNEIKFDRSRLAAHARKFDRTVFEEKFRRFLDEIKTF